MANDVDYGLTAGFYGTEEEVGWFFENIQAGVVYANRPQGATTGAWPGFQPFGGWKGSGSSGKNAGGHYYLQLYMHEQIQTLIRRADPRYPSSMQPNRVARSSAIRFRPHEVMIRHLLLTPGLYVFDGRRPAAWSWGLPAERSGQPAFNLLIFGVLLFTGGLLLWVKLRRKPAQNTALFHVPEAERG